MRWWGATVAALLAATVGLAVAQALDTSTPSVIIVGAPPGIAPMDRLDSRRLGQSATVLPAKPVELWRRELAGGLDVIPLVDDDGNILAALASSQVVKLDPKGRRLWWKGLGSDEPALAPVMTSNGGVVVLSADGVLWSVSSAGALRFRVDLGVATRRASAAPLAFDDGSVVVAGESQLVRVESDGRIRNRVALHERIVGGLISYQGGVLVTTYGGNVHTWRPPNAPRKLGKFDGEPNGGGVLLSHRALGAVVDTTEVVLLDLESSRTTVLAGGTGYQRRFEGPMTLDRSGVLYVSTVAGELLGVDSSGMLVRRMALENALLLFGADAGVPSVFHQRDHKPSPPMVVDPGGRLGFARASGRVGVVDEAGVVHVASHRFCSRVLGVLPAGKERMLVACRSGSVGLFGSE